MLKVALIALKLEVWLGACEYEDAGDAGFYFHQTEFQPGVHFSFA